MQSSMSPAQQYQTSPSLFFPPPTGSLPLSHHPVSPYTYTSTSAHSHSKFTAHFSPVRPDPVAGNVPWNGSHYKCHSHIDSQISSPASLDSTGDTGHSSPTSPLSPGTRQDQWYPPPPFFTNPSFPPPNTVAPPSELHHGHRPDAVFGGGGHRQTAPPLRGGMEMVQDTRESYSARHYGGSSNTVAPLNTSSSPYSMGHSPGAYSRAGSCSSYGSMMSPPEGQFSVQVTELLVQLGISETELILKSTRDLNKFLKSKGLNRDIIRTIKQQRRTMKNRGYAAACRIKREEQCKKLKEELTILEQDITDTSQVSEVLNVEIGEVRNKRVFLEKHITK